MFAKPNFPPLLPLFSSFNSPDLFSPHMKYHNMAIMIVYFHIFFSCV